MADKKKRAPWSWKKKLSAMFAAAAVLASSGVVWWSVREEPVEIIDVTAKAATARYKKSGVLKRARKRKNPAKDLIAITLHQTGTRGVGTKAWPFMTAHYGVQKDGRVYRIHPPEVYLFASNATNGRSLAIEVAGLFGKQDMPEAQVRGLHQAIRLAKADAKAIGATLTEIYGHRQTTKGKPFGPQRSITVNGMVWADSKNVLAFDVDQVFGTGRAIPQKWLIPDGADELEASSFGAFDFAEVVDEPHPDEAEDDFFGDLDENPDM